MPRMRLVIILCFLAALVSAAAGAGVAVRTVLVPRASSATFSADPVHWYCYDGSAISCTSGDALPYATLSHRAITIRVNSLRRACFRRVLRPSPDPSDPQMQPYYEYIYTFKAVGQC
jgi:hypothetical protein